MALIPYVLIFSNSPLPSKHHLDIASLKTQKVLKVLLALGWGVVAVKPVGLQSLKVPHGFDVFVHRHRVVSSRL